MEAVSAAGERSGWGEAGRRLGVIRVGDGLGEQRELNETQWESTNKYTLSEG